MTTDDLLKFLGQVVIHGGGSAVIAYGMFQFLGEKWIENKFAQRMEQFRHQQALELQRLKVEIDSLLSGALKLQEKEFSLLPEAWAKLDEAYGLIAGFVSPMQMYPDIDRLTSIQLEEFLVETELRESQKNEVRTSGKKGQLYQEIIFWHRLSKVKHAYVDLQNFIARNGIFLPTELEGKFSRISEALWTALTWKEVGHEAKDWKMQSEGWKRLSEEIAPLYKEIKIDIQTRLQSHGRKPLSSSSALSKAQ